MIVVGTEVTVRLPGTRGVASGTVRLIGMKPPDNDYLVDLPHGSVWVCGSELRERNRDPQLFDALDESLPWDAPQDARALDSFVPTEQRIQEFSAYAHHPSISEPPSLEPGRHRVTPQELHDSRLKHRAEIYAEATLAVLLEPLGTPAPTITAEVVQRIREVIGTVVESNL